MVVNKFYVPSKLAVVNRREAAPLKRALAGFVPCVIPKVSKQARVVHKRLAFSVAASPHALERCLHRCVAHLQVICELCHRPKHTITVIPLTLVHTVRGPCVLPLGVPDHPLPRALLRLSLAADSHVHASARNAATANGVRNYSRRAVRIVPPGDHLAYFRGPVRHCLDGGGSNAVIAVPCSTAAHSNTSNAPNNAITVAISIATCNTCRALHHYGVLVRAAHWDGHGHGGDGIAELHPGATEQLGSLLDELWCVEAGGYAEAQRGVGARDASHLPVAHGVGALCVQ